eukprot:4280945-Alexandrium_andersonii.AAC.1
MAGKQLCVTVAGASVQLAWGMARSSDPIKHAAAPLVRYAEEWWRALGRRHAQPDNFKAGQLVHMFRKVRPSLRRGPRRPGLLSRGLCLQCFSGWAKWDGRSWGPPSST